MSLKLLSSVSWLVLIRNNQILPIFGFSDSEYYDIRKYVKNLLDYGIICDDSVFELLRRISKE